MLKWWPTHAEYQLFLSVAVTTLNESQLKRFYSYSDSLDKLTSMNLDPVGGHLLPYYSDTGRPALNQPQILLPFPHWVLTMTLLIGYGSGTLNSKNQGVRMFSPVIKTRKPLPSQAKTKNFQTAIPVLLKRLLTMPLLAKTFLSITKNFCKNFFPLPPLYPLWSSD